MLMISRGRVLCSAPCFALQPWPQSQACPPSLTDAPAGMSRGTEQSLGEINAPRLLCAPWLDRPAIHSRRSQVYVSECKYKLPGATLLAARMPAACGRRREDISVQAYEYTYGTNCMVRCAFHRRRARCRQSDVPYGTVTSNDLCAIALSLPARGSSSLAHGHRRCETPSYSSSRRVATRKPQHNRNNLQRGVWQETSRPAPSPSPLHIVIQRFSFAPWLIGG